MAACFIRLKKSQKDRKSANKMKVKVFCNLTLEVTNYHLCPVLFIRSKPLGPAYPQRKGITRARIPRGEGHWEPVRGLTTTGYQWAIHRQRMIYKLMRRCSASLMMRKLQIKIIKRNHVLSIILGKIKY